MAFPFFATGYLFKSKIKESKLSNASYLIFSIVLLCISITLSLHNGQEDMSEANSGYNLAIFYLNGFIGTFSVIFFCKLFKDYYNNVILYYARNTLTIFATHSILITIIVKIFTSIFYKGQIKDDIQFMIIEGVIVSFIVLISSFVPIFIINKYIPFVAGAKRKEDK